MLLAPPDEKEHRDDSDQQKNGRGRLRGLHDEFLDLTFIGECPCVGDDDKARWIDLAVVSPGQSEPPDAARRKAIGAKVHEEIVEILNERAAAPLGGLAGVPLVNVLEVNLALRERYRTEAVAAR